MINICFVCTGNTCRSIMAERLMKKRLKDLKINDIKVSSKGLKANHDNITENAKSALKLKHALATNRKSVKLNKIDPKTIYVTMNEQQKQAIIAKQTMSFKDLIGIEISDPYGQDLNAYLMCANMLEQGIDVLINKILKWRG